MEVQCVFCSNWIFIYCLHEPQVYISFMGNSFIITVLFEITSAAEITIFNKHIRNVAFTLWPWIMQFNECLLYHTALSSCPTFIIHPVNLNLFSFISDTKFPVLFLVSSLSFPLLPFIFYLRLSILFQHHYQFVQVFSLSCLPIIFPFWFVGSPLHIL